PEGAGAPAQRRKTRRSTRAASKEEPQSQRLDVKLTPLTSRPAAGALGRTRNEGASCSGPWGGLSKRRPVPGYERGTGAGLANVPFYSAQGGGSSSIRKTGGSAF